MTQNELEREVARATGESVATIRSRGFSLVDPSELGPHVMDWDTVYPSEPPRARRNRRRRIPQAA